MFSSKKFYPALTGCKRPISSGLHDAGYKGIATLAFVLLLISGDGEPPID